MCVSVFGLDNDLLETKKDSQMKARHSESTSAGLHSCPTCLPLFGTIKAHVNAHCTDTNPYFLSLSHTQTHTAIFWC